MGHRWRGVDIRAIERAQVRHPEEAEADADPVLQDLQRAHQTGRTISGQPAALQPTDADGVSAQGDGFDHVRSAHEAAGDDDRRPPGRRGYHLGQDVEGTAAVVELAPAVVGDVDALHAVLARDQGVLGGGNALQDQRNVVRVLEALDVIPGERGLEVVPRGPHPPRLDEAPREVAFAGCRRPCPR